MSLRPLLLPKLHQHHAAYTIPSSGLNVSLTQHHRSLPSTPSSSSNLASSSRSRSRVAAFSTSLPRSQDHYKTLGVSRSASSKEIKAQFYQLSKRYHPDVNRDDEGAKKKFQEVSEAWGVLGNERGRRDYDRQIRTGGGGGGGGPTQNYSYDPGDNAARRARATYAWEYQRRRGDSNRGRAGQARSPRPGDDQEDTRSAYARARGATGAGLGGAGGGRGSGAESSLFEKYAAQQRKREEFASSRTSSSTGSTGYGGASGSASDPFSPRVEEHEAQGASPIIRFIQIIGTLTFIFAVATSLGTGGSSGGGGRLRAEGQSKEEEEDEEEWKGRSVVVLPRSARRLPTVRGQGLVDGVRID